MSRLIQANTKLKSNHLDGSVVEQPPQDQEEMVSKLNQVINKTLKYFRYCFFA